jgi:hypothetical protein
VTSHYRTQPPERDAQWAQEWLPLFSARLCAALHGEELPAAPSGYRVGPGKKLTPEKWHELLRLSQSVTVNEARRKLRVPQWLVSWVIRREPRLATWYRRAVPIGQRAPCRPSIIQMSAILATLVKNPGMSARTACKLHGVRSYYSFLDQTLRPEWESRYLRAKSLQRVRSFEGLGEQIDGAPKLTQRFRRGINQQVDRLTRLEPRRLWSKKPRTELQEARRRARRGQRSKTE